MSALKKVGVLFGCRDVVFAKMTADTTAGTTYEMSTDTTPVPVINAAPGVIEIGMTAQITSEQLGADDVPLYEMFNNLEGFEVNITMASLSDDARALLLGNTVDTNGVLIEAADDDAPYVAMGFKAARSDGSDDYIWLYKGKFAMGDSTFRTKEKGQVNWQTPQITGTFAQRISDGRVRATLNVPATGTPPTAAATFFDEVYED